MKIKLDKNAKTLFPCITLDNRISYDEGGRVFCDNCKSQSGIKVRNYYHKGVLKMWRKCIACGSTEIIDNHTGEILAQKQVITFIDKYKGEFLPVY